MDEVSDEMPASVELAVFSPAVPPLPFLWYREAREGRAAAERELSAREEVGSSGATEDTEETEDGEFCTLPTPRDANPLVPPRGLVVVNSGRVVVVEGGALSRE